MSSGFSGTGHDFYTTGGFTGRSMAATNATPQNLYPGIFSDSGSQIHHRRPEFIGKRSLAEFQTQQQQQNHLYQQQQQQQALVLYLRNIKQRTFQHPSPISTLSPPVHVSSISPLTLLQVQDGLELEEGDFRPDFKEYAKRELIWSRLYNSGKPDDDCPNKYSYDFFRQGIRWVFWSRQDDYPDRPLHHDNFVASISDASPSPEVRENIRLALHKIILDPCLDDTLVQFWAPTKTLEDRTLLTTKYQPFALGITSGRDDRQRLCEYRMEMCRKYNNCFYADAESGEEQLGVPGRVFLHKSAEFNDDVQHYSLKECPQRDLALRCRIRGYLALPVFERSSQTCIGVLEISIQDPSLNLYGYQKDFLRHVFDRFQDFGLQCIFRCKDCEMRDEDKDKDKNKNNALAVAFKELGMVLESVRKLHELPLAMTWVPASSLTGSELYALEFFLPPITKDDDNILTRLSSILRTVEENSQTFKLACSQEFGGGLSVEVIDFPNGQRSHSIQMIEDTRVFPTLVPFEDGGGMLQLDQPDQPSMDAANSRMNGISEAQNYNLPSVEPLQNGKVATQLDSSDQSSMDPANNGQDVLTAKRNILEVTSSEESKRKTQKTEHRKSGFKIEVSLEDILKCSKISRDDAAKKLEVSISTLKRLCRDYGINRWPPRNMKTVHSPRPLPFENQEQIPRLSPDLPSNQVSAQEQTPRLSSDLPSNQVSASVVPIMPACQDEDLVTIRAEYGDLMIKFQLSLLSTLVELHQEVAKRLNLEAGSYFVKYKDEDDMLILIACDDDLQYCACYFRSVGKTPIVVQLVPKRTS